MNRRVISLPEPLDLVATLSAFQRSHRDPCMRVSRAEAWRATRTPDGPATLHLERDGSALQASAWGEGAQWALEHVDELIGAHDDPRAFEPTHALLRDAHRRLAGLRLGRTGAVMEALVPSILEQKVTGIEATRSFVALIKVYGEDAPGPGGLRLPPTPAALAALPSWAFHPLGVERKRADIIRRACARAGRLEETASMVLPEAYARLQAVQGVGAWTAAEVARVALGDPDAVSVGDFHLKNVVAWALAGEPRATDERMLELLEPYRGQRARAIRLIEATGITPPRYGPRMPIRSITTI